MLGVFSWLKKSRFYLLSQRENNSEFLFFALIWLQVFLPRDVLLAFFRACFSATLNTRNRLYTQLTTYNIHVNLQVQCYTLSQRFVLPQLLYLLPLSHLLPVTDEKTTHIISTTEDTAQKGVIWHHLLCSAQSYTGCHPYIILLGLWCRLWPFFGNRKGKDLTGVFEQKVRAVLSYADCREPTANNILLQTWLRINWLVAATIKFTKKKIKCLRSIDSKKVWEKSKCDKEMSQIHSFFAHMHALLKVISDRIAIPAGWQQRHDWMGSKLE